MFQPVPSLACPPVPRAVSTEYSPLILSQEGSFQLGLQGVALWHAGHRVVGDRILWGQSWASGQTQWCCCGGGRAGAARPGMSSLLGHQPAFKELWLNEMFWCAKSLLGNVTGQLSGGWAWPGQSAQRCQERCWSAAWKGQCSPLLPLLLEPARPASQPLTFPLS